ncbi:MAG TPA: JAB domain-containing protein [Sphingomonadaceae bacterium]|nr:JAB domain-containing protein [Sphingomonadaceae bacterium]
MRRPRFMRSSDAAAFFAPGFAHMRREALRVAHLDCRRRLIGVRLLYSDQPDALDFPLRTIIADALALESDGLILAHNHPSGNAMPSPADIDATRTLADLAQPLGIRLFDHLIFGCESYRSLRAMGLL